MCICRQCRAQCSVVIALWIVLIVVLLFVVYVKCVHVNVCSSTEDLKLKYVKSFVSAKSSRQSHRDWLVIYFFLLSQIMADPFHWASGSSVLHVHILLKADDVDCNLLHIIHLQRSTCSVSTCSVFMVLLSSPAGLGLTASLHGLQQLHVQQPAQPGLATQDQVPVPGEHRPHGLGHMSIIWTADQLTDQQHRTPPPPSTPPAAPPHAPPPPHCPENCSPSKNTVPVRLLAFLWRSAEACASVCVGANVCVRMCSSQRASETALHALNASSRDSNASWRNKKKRIILKNKKRFVLVHRTLWVSGDDILIYLSILAEEKGALLFFFFFVPEAPGSLTCFSSTAASTIEHVTEWSTERQTCGDFMVL